jgi:hypothetical protein
MDRERLTADEASGNGGGGTVPLAVPGAGKGEQQGSGGTTVAAPPMRPDSAGAGTAPPPVSTATAATSTAAPPPVNPATNPALATPINPNADSLEEVDDLVTPPPSGNGQQAEEQAPPAETAPPAEDSTATLGEDGDQTETPQDTGAVDEGDDLFTTALGEDGNQPDDELPGIEIGPLDGPLIDPDLGGGFGTGEPPLDETDPSDPFTSGPAGGTDEVDDVVDDIEDEVDDLEDDIEDEDDDEDEREDEEEEDDDEPDPTSSGSVLEEDVPADDGPDADDDAQVF